MSVRAPEVNCERMAGEIMPGKPRRFNGTSVIDIFAGGGGSTVGAETARAQVCFAINHNSKAIEAHALNHPHTAHCCEDVFRFDFNRAFDVVERATGHGTPSMIWASPSCVTHSSARSRGKRMAAGRHFSTPTEDRQRATPWSVTSAAYTASFVARDERRHAPFVIVENVLNFKNRWALYPSWRESLHACGYTSSEHALQALDYGVAAERERLFVVFTPLTVSRTPFVIHVPRKRVLGDKHGWSQGIAVPKECQLGRYLARDFGGPGWDACKDLSDDHLAKFSYNLARARSMTGGAPPEYWTYQYTTGTKPRFVEHPQRTITAECGGQIYVVHSAGNQHHERLARMSELRGWFGFPASYKLPETPSAAGRLIGNAVVPAIAESIVRQIMERA